MEVPAALGLDPSVANSGKWKQFISFNLFQHVEVFWFSPFTCLLVWLPLITVIFVPAYYGLAVHRVINHAVGSVLPNGLQRGILDGIFILGRAQLSDFILNEKNPLGYSRLAKLRRIFDEGKSLQLQFPAEDLGFRYHHDSTTLVTVLKLLLFLWFSTSWDCLWKCQRLKGQTYLSYLLLMLNIR